MSLRRAFFWLHLAAGLTAGAVIFVMCVTGVLLTYEKQMIAWADGHRAAPPSPDARRLPVETLLAAASASEPGAAPASLVMQADPTAAAAVNLGRSGTLFLDPYSGAVLGKGSVRVRAFFRTVTDWHRWLAFSGESRQAARAVTGAANLLFLFIVLSGLVLWWPRSWSAQSLKAIVLFRGGLRGKARDFNWHNVIGVWSWAPLVLVVASAATISYPWAGDLVYRVAGEEPPRRPAAAPAPARGEAGAPSFDGLNLAWERAERQVAGWTSITMRIPSGNAPVAFTIDSASSGIRPDQRAQLSVDRRTAETARFEPYASQSLGRRLRSWPRWIHTGEAAGPIGQSIAGLASLGGAVLVWTGWALAWRRFRGWLAQRRPVAAAAIERGSSQLSEETS